MSVSLFVTYEPDGSPPLPDKDRKPLNLLVSRLQPGEDVVQSVYKQAKGELRLPIEDYALYWPDHKIWISPDSMLGHVNITSGSKLCLRPKKRQLKIRFLDGSSKLILVDETKLVKEVVKDLCLQLGLSHHEELSLVVAGDYAVQKHHPAKTAIARVGSASPVNSQKTYSRKETRSAGSIKEQHTKDVNTPPLSPGLRRKQRPGSASKKQPKQYSTWTVKRVKKQISKKHQIRLDTPWLDPNKTLTEQEVTITDELILMYRFYYSMELSRGSVNVEMLFKQARATYLAGELLCSPNDMVRLSAILCQITKGNYSASRYNPDFLTSLKNIIAPPKCKIKTIAKKITAEHSSLEGLSAQDAKCWFVKLWSSLELFGMEFLSCTNTDTKDKGLIGISKNRVLFLFHKKKKNISWDADTLIQWKHDASKDTVALTFSYDGSTEILNLQLPDYSGVLVDCLQGHRELGDSVPDMARFSIGYQFDDELESAISDFATQTKMDAKVRRALNNLTYDDVYWASKIENPLLSEEELAQLQSSSWENPVFANMDQLMEERFDFLDFDEYSHQEVTGHRDTLDVPANALTGSSPESSPPSSIIRHYCSNPSLTNQSPLVANRQSANNSTEGIHRSSLHESSSNGVTNGLQDSSKLSIFHSRGFGSGHSRSGSSGSWSVHSEGEKDSGVGSTGTSSNLTNSVPSEKGKNVGRAASPNIFISKFENVHLSEKKKRPASYVA